MTKKERMGKTGLLGPKRVDKYLEWRRARDNAIANPRRLKSVKDAEAKRS